MSHKVFAIDTGIGPAALLLSFMDEDAVTMPDVSRKREKTAMAIFMVLIDASADVVVGEIRSSSSFAQRMKL